MPVKKMDREQQKYILQRLSNVKYFKGVKSIKPTAVVKAESVVEEYKRKTNAENEKARNTWNRKYESVRELVYSGNFDDALAALKKLEAEYGI